MRKNDSKSQGNSVVRIGMEPGNSVKVNDHPFLRDFVFRPLAPGELWRALRVRRAVYGAELGYQIDGILQDPLDGSARHFIGTTRIGEPVAAMRIIIEDKRPFELESFVNIAPFLEKGARAGEISRMCILPEFRSLTRNRFVHAGMWKLAWDYAAACGLTEFWIWAPPSIVGIYEYLGFRKVPDLNFLHPLFDNKAYQVLRIDLRTLEDEYRRRKHPLSSILFAPPLTA